MASSETLQGKSKKRRRDETNSPERNVTPRIIQADVNPHKEVTVVDTDFLQNLLCNAENDQENSVQKETKTVATTPGKNEHEISDDTSITDTLLISNLTRPFPLPALKEMLSVSGQRKVVKFWIDDFRSYCFVTFSTKVEAKSCRDQVHNLIWQPNNHERPLEATFVCSEYAQKCIESKIKPDSNSLKAMSGNAHALTKLDESKASKLAATKDVNTNNNMDKSHQKNFQINIRNRKSPNNDRQLSAPVQMDTNRNTKTSTHTTNVNNVAICSTQPKSKNQSNPQVDSALGPLEKLSTLFLKTETEPTLYYLPLTESQVEAKRQMQYIRAQSTFFPPITYPYQ